MRIGPVWLAIVVIALVVTFGSLFWRSSAMLDSTDTLLADARELLNLLHSVNDAASARTAATTLPAAIKKVEEGGEELLKQAEETDRHGGVTKGGYDSVIKKMADYQWTMNAIAGEYERIHQIPNLPDEFVTASRGHTTPSTQAHWQKRAPSIPAESQPVNPPEPSAPLAAGAPQIKQESPAQPPTSLTQPTRNPSPNRRPPSFGDSPQSHSYEEYVGLYGKANVVRVQIVNYGEIVPQMERVARALANSAPESNSCDMKGSNVVLAPVFNWDAFCNRLDFAEIVDRDDGQKIVTLKIDPTQVGGRADQIANPFGEPAVGSNREIVSQILQQSGTGEDSSTPDSQAKSESANDGKNPFNAEHKNEAGVSEEPQNKYAKLAVEINSDEALARLVAVDALLVVKPSDVEDPMIRKSIARGYRTVATCSDPFQAVKGIQGLVIWGGKYSAPILVELMEKDKPGIEDEVYNALAELKDPAGAEAMTRHLASSSNHDRAAKGLRKMGEVGEAALMKATSEDDADIALAAVKLLGEFGTQKSHRQLEVASKSPNDEIRSAASEAMKEIEERTKAAADETPGSKP